MNQTPTLSEPQIPMIQMMDYDKPPFRLTAHRFASCHSGEEKIVGAEGCME